MKGRMKHPEHGFHVPMPGEVEDMLKNGWVWEEAEAPAAPPDPQPPKVETVEYEDGTTASGMAPLPSRSPAEQRAALEAEATSLGVQFRANIGDAKLAERIAEARGQQ